MRLSSRFARFFGHARRTIAGVTDVTQAHGM